MLDALLQSGVGHAPVGTPRLGLVLWTEDAQGGQVAKQLTSTLASIAVACDVLLLCPDAALPAALAAATLAAAGQAAAPTGHHAVHCEAGGASDAVLIALARIHADYLCFHHLADQMAPPGAGGGPRRLGGAAADRIAVRR